MEAAGVLTAVLGLGFLLSSTLSLLPTTPHFSPSCPLRLTHLLFLISLLLWLIFQFTTLLLLSPVSCNVLSILTSLFDQLSRFLLLTLLLFAVRPPHLATPEKAVVYVLIALRFVLGATVAGFTRSAFIPVCFPEAEHREHGRSAGVTVLAFDGMIMVVTVLRAAGVWRGARKAAGNVGGKQELGLLGVTIAGWGWAVAAVPGQLRVGSIFLRLFPGSVMLAILLELLKRFPNSFFLLQQQSEISLRVAGMGSGSVSDPRLQRLNSDASEVRSFPGPGSHRDLESRGPASWTTPPSHNSISHPNLIETHHPSHAGGRPNISGPMLTNGVLISQSSGMGGRDVRTVSLGAAANRERERVDAILLREEEERYRLASRTGLSVSESTGTPRTIASFSGLPEQGMPPMPGVGGAGYAESVSTHSITTTSSRPSRTLGSNSSRRPSIPRVPVPGSVVIPGMGMPGPRPPMVAVLPPDFEGSEQDKQYRNTYSTESSGRYTMSQAGFALAPPPPGQGFAADRSIPSMPLSPEDPRMGEQMIGDSRMAQGEQRVLFLNRISYDNPALIRSLESSGALQAAARATGFATQINGVLRRSPSGSRNHSPQAQSDTEKESPVLPTASFSQNASQGSQDSKALQAPEVPKGRLTPIIHRKHPSGTFSQRDSERVLFPRDIEFPSPPRNRPKSTKSLKSTTVTVRPQSDEPLPTSPILSTTRRVQRKPVPEPIQVLPVRKSSLAVNPPPQSAFNGGMGMVAQGQEKSPMTPYETAKAWVENMAPVGNNGLKMVETHGRKGSASSTMLLSSAVTQPIQSTTITRGIEPETMETVDLATGSTLNNSAAEDIHITLSQGGRKESNSSSQDAPSLSRTTESTSSSNTFPSPEDRDADSYDDGDGVQLFNLSASSTTESIILSALSSAIELEALQSSLPPFQGAYQTSSSSQFLSPGRASFGVPVSRKKPRLPKHFKLGDPIPTFTSKPRGYGRRKQPPAPLGMVPLRDHRPPPPPPPIPDRASKPLPAVAVIAGGVPMQRVVERRVSTLPEILEPPRQISPAPPSSTIAPPSASTVKTDAIQARLTMIHSKSLTQSSTALIPPMIPAAKSSPVDSHRNSLLQHLEAEAGLLETQWKGMRQTLLINRDSFISVDSGLGSVDTRRTSLVNARRNSGLQQKTTTTMERRLSMVTDASMAERDTSTLGSGADNWQKQLAAAQAEYLRDEAVLRGKLNHPPLDDPFRTPGQGDGSEFDVVILSDEDSDDDEDEEEEEEDINNNRFLSLGQGHLQLPSAGEASDIEQDRISPLPATVYINPTIILSPAPSPLPTPPQTPPMDGDVLVRNSMISGDSSELAVASVELPEMRHSEMYSEILAMDILCSPKTSIMWKPLPASILPSKSSSASNSLLWSPSSSVATSHLKSRGSGLSPAAVTTRPIKIKRTVLEFQPMILESNKLWQKAPRRATDTQVKRGGLWRDPNFRPKSILARDGSVKRSGSRRRVTFRVDDDGAVPVPVLPGGVNTGGDVMVTSIPSFPRPAVHMAITNPRVNPRAVNLDNFPAVPIRINPSPVIKLHASGTPPIPAQAPVPSTTNGTATSHLDKALDRVITARYSLRALPSLPVMVSRPKSYLWQQPRKSVRVGVGRRSRLWPAAEALNVEIKDTMTRGKRARVQEEAVVSFNASSSLWKLGNKNELWKKKEVNALWPHGTLAKQTQETSFLWMFTQSRPPPRGNLHLTAASRQKTGNTKIQPQMEVVEFTPATTGLWGKNGDAKLWAKAEKPSPLWPHGILRSEGKETPTLLLWTNTQSRAPLHGNIKITALPTQRRKPSPASAVPDSDSLVGRGAALWKAAERFEKVPSSAKGTGLWQQFRHKSPLQPASSPQVLEHVALGARGAPQQFQAEVQQFQRVQNSAHKRRARIVKVEMKGVDEDEIKRQQRFVIKVAGRVFESRTLRSTVSDLSAIPTNFMGSLLEDSMTKSALLGESESLRSGGSSGTKHLWVSGASAKSSSSSSTKSRSNSSKSMESPTHQTLWTLSSSDADAPGFLFSNFTSSDAFNPAHRPRPVISAEDMPKSESLWTLDINHNHSSPKPQLWKSSRSISVKGLWKDAPLLVHLQEYHAGGKLWRKTDVKPVQDRKAASELSSKTLQAQMLAPSKSKQARSLQAPSASSAVNKPITRSAELTRLTKRAEVQVHGGLWERQPRHVEAERSWMKGVVSVAAQESGKTDNIQKENKKNNSEIQKDSNNSEHPSPAILEQSKQQSNRILIKSNISDEINPAHVQPEVKVVARHPGLKGRLWTATAAAAAAAVSPPIERENADCNQESSKTSMPPPPVWIRETASRTTEARPERGATAQRKTSSTVTPASGNMWENRNIVVRKGRVVVSAEQLWNAPESASQQPPRPVFRQTNKRTVVATEDTRALWTTSVPEIVTPPRDTTTTTTTTTTSSTTAAPLWTPEAASRTTTATPERTITAPRKQSIDLPKATGSLWNLQLPEDIVVKKGKVVVSGSGSEGLWTHDEESHAPHALRRTTSSITVRGIEMTDAKDDVETVEVKVAGRLWTASLKRPQSPAPPTDQAAPLWAKDTAKRTTTAVPERGIVVPRKTTAELPKATGSLWEGRSVVVKKGKVVVDSALWDGSDIATEAAPVLRHSKSSRTLIAVQDEDNHPKIEVQVAGRLWIAETPKQPEIPAAQLNIPLWSSATASRTTDASPARIPAPQKKVTPTSESLTVPKAEGSLWDGRDIIVRKGKVVVNSSMSLWSHNEAAARPALRRSTSSITVIPVEKEEVRAAIEVKVAGRLWTARVEPPAPKITAPPSPLWSKETAQRTTTAIPERVVTAPRKMSVDLPKATGSLWSGRDVVVKKGKVVVTPTPHLLPALWGNTSRPVLRRQKSSVTVIPVKVAPVEPKKLEISVAGRLWTAAVLPPVIIHAPVPLWAPHTASRTTTAVPERVNTAPRKATHPPKATGSLWKAQDVVVKKHSVVVNPLALWTKPVEEHAPVIRKSKSRITLTPLVIDTPVQQVATVKVAGRLWTAALPAAPVAVSEPQSPLWAASTASRTTSAVPERVQTAPRKAPIDLPKATGSLWQNRQITIKKGRIIVSEELVNSHLKPALEQQPAILRRQTSSRTIVALSEDSTPAPAPLRIAGRIITPSRTPSRAVSRASSPQRRPSLWTPTSPASSDPRDVIPANYNVTIAHNKIHLLTSSSTSTEFGDYHTERATPPAPLNLKETLWSPPASPVRLASPILPSFTWSKHTASRTTTQPPVKGVIVAKKMRGGNAVQVASGALWNETQEQQEDRPVVRRAKSSRTLRAVSREESEQQEPQFAISVGGRIMTAQVPRRMRTPSPTLGQPASISPGSTISDSSIEEGDQQDGHKVQVVRINSGSHNALWTPRVVVAQRSLEELAEEKRQAEELEEMERLKRVRDAERVMREENERLEVEERRLERRRSMEFIKAKEKEQEEKERREKGNGEGGSKVEGEKKSGGFLQSVISNRKEKKGGWYGGLGLF